MKDNQIDSDIETRVLDLEAFERVIRIINNSTIVGSGAREISATLNVLDSIKQMIEMDSQRLRSMALDKDQI